MAELQSSFNAPEVQKKVCRTQKNDLEIWGIEPQTSSMLKKRYTTKPYPLIILLGPYLPIYYQN